MLYCIGGVSGAGKTRLRERHPDLNGLPHIDIADIYLEAETNGDTLSWQDALEELATQLQALLDQGERHVVLEAFFCPGGPARDRVTEIADEHDQDVVFLWCAAPRAVCARRVSLQRRRRDTPRRRAKRLRFISEVEGKWFKARPSEEPKHVLARHGAAWRQAEVKVAEELWDLHTMMAALK